MEDQEPPTRPERERLAFPLERLRCRPIVGERLRWPTGCNATLTLSARVPPKKWVVAFAAPHFVFKPGFIEEPDNKLVRVVWAGVFIGVPDGRGETLFTYPLAIEVPARGVGEFFGLLVHNPTNVLQQVSIAVRGKSDGKGIIGATTDSQMFDG